MKVWVIATLCQGVLDELLVFSTKEKAYAHFKKETGINFDDYENTEKEEFHIWVTVVDGHVG